MKVKKRNNLELRRILKSDVFINAHKASGISRADFLQKLTGYGRTYVFAWMAKKTSQSYMPMPDTALRLLKLELRLEQPMIADLNNRGLDMNVQRALDQLTAVRKSASQAGIAA
jgi:hypothetical protein